MKQLVYKIMLLMVAMAVFTTGMGANIVKYCCTDCKENTLFMLQAHDCHAVHHSHCDSMVADDDNKSHTCCNSNSATTHASVADSERCSISRISIDLDSFMFKPQLNAPMIWLTGALAFTPTQVPPADQECANDCAHLISPLPDTPRQYLSLIRILII